MNNLTVTQVQDLGLVKPVKGQNCNSCGYCCTAQPCDLAVEYLKCDTGPCVALEIAEGKTRCGLVRNPLGYLYAAARPGTPSPALEPAPSVALGHEMSINFATMLGLGAGCDAVDDDESDSWNRAAKK